MRSFFALTIVALSLCAPLSSARAQRVVDLELVPTARAQIAVWITDADGNYLATLALTEAVARRGIGNRPGASMMNSGFHWPYGRREGVLPLWAHARASAPGAELFRRVIFQDRLSEGHASRSSNDSTRDTYFCLSFNTSTTTRDALDAVACASVFNSDKGRYITPEDVANGYFEPHGDDTGETTRFPLDLFSLYPPRRDAATCAGDGCVDHPDAALYAADVTRIMPEIDAVTRATPPEGEPMRVMYTLPESWPDGTYRVRVEVNTEGDYNATFNDETFPTPINPPLTTGGEFAQYWDFWAMNYGYPYRGQPSVLYEATIEVGAGEATASTAEPIGYGSLSGQGTDAGEMREMDGTITDDPVGAPGSGADRLFDLGDGSRIRVTSVGPRVCEVNTPPTAPVDFTVSPFSDRRNAHHYAHLSFGASSDDHGVVRYEVRVGTSPITDEESFLRAVPAKAARLEDEALTVPVNVVAGEPIEVDFGGLVFETHYWVGVRAVDRCNQESDIVVSEITTLPIEFTTVSPCFVATAAYGSPMAEEIGALRRFRDRHLLSNPVGAALVSVYETIGPVLADVIRDDEDLRAAVRWVLAPIVQLLR